MTRHTRTCTVDGCERKHYAHGYCSMHGYRVKRHGRPDIVLKPGRPRLPARPCFVPSCWRRAVARNLCTLHYNRKLRAELRAKLRQERGEPA